MQKDNVIELVSQLGKLTGVMEGVIKSQDNNAHETRNNTAEIKHLSAFMNKTQGASEERDKHYRRVKHTSISSMCLAIGALIKAFTH